jgi:hypothetical protein
MTSSSAPLDTPEKKKSNPIIRWVFRLVIFFVVVVVFCLVAMNVLNGTGSVQKSSIESIIGDVFKGNGYIKNLHQFSALPYVTLEIEDSVVLDARDEKRLLMNADYFAFHTGLINIILKRPIFRRIEVTNFFAAPGTLAKKAIIIDHVKPVEGSNKLSIKGQYSKLPFAFTAEMEPLYAGSDLTYGFKLAEVSTVEGTISDLELSFNTSNAGNGMLFDNLILQRNGKPLATGSIKIAQGLDIVADLLVNKANVHATLHYDTSGAGDKTRIKGEMRVKALDLSTISSEDDAIKALHDASQMILALINAPVDVLFRDPDAEEKHSPLFAGLDVDIDIQLKNLQFKGAHLGDLQIPVKITDDALTVPQLSGQLNGGAVVGSLALHENKAREIVYSHDIALSQWDFGQFLTDLETSHSNIKGKANVKSIITSTAPALNKIINATQGAFNIVVADTEMKSAVADKLLSGLVYALIPKLEDESTSQINCAIGHFSIKDGIASVDALFADTPSLQLAGRGDLDLIKQQYNLKFTAESKGAALLDVMPSVRLKGPFKAPQIGKNPSGSLLGMANPALLAESLTVFGLGKDHICSQFLAAKQDSPAPIIDSKE